MRHLHYVVYVILFVNIFFIFIGYPDSSKDYELMIENIQNGYGSHSDYDLYNTYVHKDSLGVSTFIVTTELAYVEKESNDKKYYLTDSFRVKNYYEHSNLGTQLIIQKDDFIKLSVLGDWLFLFYRLVYILVCVLILFFIRGFRKGRIFSSKMISYLQFVGIITLLFGYLSPNKNKIIEYVLRDYCDIPIKTIPTSFLWVGNTLYILLGIFLLLLAYCFGRGNYLEKQNDLTI